MKTSGNTAAPSTQQSQNDISKDKYQSLLKLTEELQNKLEILTSKYRQLIDKTQALIANSTDKQKYAALESEYESLKIKFADANKNIEFLTSKLEQYRNGSDKLSGLTKELQFKLEDVLKENKKLAEKVSDYENLKNEKIELARQNEELKIKFTELISKSRKLLDENIELKKSVENHLASAAKSLPEKNTEYKALLKEKQELID